jgi:hypothetical protein
MMSTVLGKNLIYPFRYKMKVRTTVIRLARQPSTHARIALWDDVYGLYVYDYDRATLFCREKACETLDEIIMRNCKRPESLFLGDLHAVESAELLFEQNELSAEYLKELLCRAFGYSPLHSEADRIWTINPQVRFGENYLGSLREVLADVLAVQPGA